MPAYRYVDLPDAPTAALARVEADAQARGLAAARVARRTDGLYDPERRRERLLTVRALPHAGGARVEIASATGDTGALDRVLAGAPGKILVPVDDSVVADRYGIDATVGGGVAVDGGGPHLRLDATLRAGLRLDGAAILDETERPRWSLWGHAGVGVVALDRASGLRLEVAIAIDRVRALAMAPDTAISVGPRLSVEVVAAALLFPDRAGIEGGIALRRAGWGSLWARAGWLGDGALVSGGVCVEGRVAVIAVTAGSLAAALVATALVVAQ